MLLSNIWGKILPIKIGSWGNSVLIELRECLLTFGPESFVFQFYTQKCKNLYIQKYGFASCFIWV